MSSASPVVRVARRNLLLGAVAGAGLAVADLLGAPDPRLGLTSLILFLALGVADLVIVALDPPLPGSRLDEPASFGAVVGENERLRHTPAEEFGPLREIERLLRLSETSATDTYYVLRPRLSELARQLLRGRDLSVLGLTGGEPGGGGPGQSADVASEQATDGLVASRETRGDRGSGDGGSGTASAEGRPRRVALIDPDYPRPAGRTDRGIPITEVLDLLRRLRELP
jgi:hypothetical protein